MKLDQRLTEELLSLIRGSLKGKRRRELLALVNSDKEIGETYRLLRQLVETGENLTSAGIDNALSNLSDRVFADFTQKKRHPEQKRGVLVFDSQDVPLPAGVRPATVDTRRLRFQLETGEMELSLYPVSFNSYEVLGRLTGVAAEGDIQLTAKSAHSERKAAADHFGLFRFDKLPVGRYTIVVAGADVLLGTIEFEL